MVLLYLKEDIEYRTGLFKCDKVSQKLVLYQLKSIFFYA